MAYLYAKRCNLCKYKMYNELEKESNIHQEVVRLAFRWIPAYLYAKLCHLCSCGVYRDLGKEDDVYQEAVRLAFCWIHL
jgi:hypothetical protein